MKPLSHSRVQFIRRLAALTACFVTLVGAFGAEGGGPTPRAGDAAPNFTLKTLDGRDVELKRLTESGPVVLVVLRGWPGYQCPVCARQVQDFAANAEKFAARKARVLMVYPGPAEGLKARAEEFLGNKQWPETFTLVLDPDFVFIQMYGLRWDARRETAYPATFIIARDGKVRFAHVSQTHGNRLSADRALQELERN